MYSPKRLKWILMYIINYCLTLKRHGLMLDYLGPNFVQSPSLDLQKSHFRSIFRFFWKAICPLLPWHLWMLAIAVFIDIGWRALWILMCSSTPLHLALRNSLTFAHCEAALFMYAWDFPFKSQSFQSPLWHKGWNIQAGTRTRLPWWQEGGSRFAKLNVTKKAYSRFSYVVTTRYRLTLSPHLKLLSELQVDAVHLGNGNVVIFSLLLAQQLVPEGKRDFCINFYLSIKSCWVI